MNGDMSFTAANRADQLSQESTLAAQRRCAAGLALREARRAALANPHDFRNPGLVKAAVVQVASAQMQLDELGVQTTFSIDQRKVSA